MLKEQAGVQVGTSGGKAEIISMLERQATRGGEKMSESMSAEASRSRRWSQGSRRMEKSEA
eukprot:CAMPEP_0172563286 /NCGR_PEP_ID=MMETSP1067-20121228/100219_1 /TAXON_ID=265564 ORGANISM="Thalassiosira punctigera, Strain Tpunct2005C2" /NCGR_SAMPLE_ID=MMETSP1067 /ASSEMBLY_ACC=CAM_ASM_000444 /LENGTH=60 /DNA_ID=CAMNT_0013353703 /DNA_START=39 /DNA_END=221 /DNA_ORIENTATION=-